MGMYTSVVHPVDGRELQIHTGDDQCDRYKVGYSVAWNIDERNPGHGTLLDGVYPSYSDNGLDDLVVIKDHVIIAVIPKSETVNCRDIERILGIVPYQRNWWPEKLWVEQEIETHKFSLKCCKEHLAFLKTCRGKSDEEIEAAREHYRNVILTNPIREVINYKSIARKIFKVKKAGKKGKKIDP